MTALFLNCSGQESTEHIIYQYPPEETMPAAYPDARFAVMSDLHLYNPILGTEGDAFEKALNSDRKLLLDSKDLLNYAIKAIIASEVSFVLISGDLTKDGELVNHESVAEELKALTRAGVAVYVIPGNHDINNPDAVSYSPEGTEPVSAVTPEEFAVIYGDYGYNAALYRDNDSLSYVAEPLEGLWLLAIDACRYRENVPGMEEIVSGKISQKTADWIASILQIAQDEDKAVMAMMHHGVVEHWNGQAKLHPDYLITGYQEFGKFLANWNVRMVFTGHYHAQDITLAQFDNKKIWDIETGSLITAPCPIRYVDLKNKFCYIYSIENVYRLHPGTDFAKKANAFVKNSVMQEARSVLKKYKVSDRDADYIADAVGTAFTAHYSGDENPALRPAFNKSKLGPWGRIVYGQQKYVLDGLWRDLPPEDKAFSQWLMRDEDYSEDAECCIPE